VIVCWYFRWRGTFGETNQGDEGMTVGDDF